jgi:type I restriction enzyme M protein
MLTSAKPGTGRIAVVLPQGALFRSGAEARIREHILREDRIEAVIGLAPNLFYGTGLAACVLVLRTQKPAETAGKVLIANGERLFKRGRNQNTLELEHAATLLAAYRDFADKPGLAQVATLDEIEQQSFNLHIPLYVEPIDDGEQVTLDQAIADLEAAQAAARETRAALEAELAKWGLGIAGANA